MSRAIGVRGALTLRFGLAYKGENAQRAYTLEVDTGWSERDAGTVADEAIAEVLEEVAKNIRAQFRFAPAEAKVSLRQMHAVLTADDDAKGGRR